MRSSPRWKLAATIGEANLPLPPRPAAPSFHSAMIGHRMVGPNEFRNGMTIEWEGEPYVVLQFQQSQLGRGDTFFRTKLKHLRTGAIIEQKFRDKDRFPRVRIDRVPMQYLYSDGDRHIFMNTKTYDQIPLSREQLGDALQYLKESTPLDVLMYEGEPIGVELPTTVDLVVTKTAPGFRGDTATGGGKPATLETGRTLTVPFFVNEGDRIRVDTRTGEYVERV